MCYDRVVECHLDEENNPIFSVRRLVDDDRPHILIGGFSNVGKLWSDEEIEKILEAKFNSLSETRLLKKIGKGIASRITVAGRSARAAKKAEKGEKKIADRQKLAKAKETLKKQKALRRAQKQAKRQGKPVPLSYADAGIK